jgi:hypothetical protein
MTDPSLRSPLRSVSSGALTGEQPTNVIPGMPWLKVEDYDDEDEADFDDSDDDDKPASVSQERWLSRPDFGSPEWWSKT